MGLLYKVTRVPGLVQALRGHILDLLYGLSVSGALDLKHTRVPAAQCHQAGMVLEHVRSWGIAWADSSYAPRSACQIFGIVAVLPASLSILNDPDFDLTGYVLDSSGYGLAPFRVAGALAPGVPSMGRI